MEIYRLVKFLPREETYALSDQLRRAVVSIPAIGEVGKMLNALITYRTNKPNPNT